MYGLAGLLFIVAGIVAFRPLKLAVHRRGWILVVVACLGMAGFMGVRIYQLIYPDPTQSYEILTASLALLLAILVLTGSLISGRRFGVELQSSQKLKKEVVRFQASFVHSPQISIIKDLQGVYQTTNQAYGQLLGKKDINLAGETDFKFFPRAQANSFRQEEEKVIETNLARSREEEIHGVDGDHWFQITRVPLEDYANVIFGLLVSGQDITCQKAAEHAYQILTQKITILYDAEKALGESAGSSNGWENILAWAGKLGDTAHSGLWQVVPEKSTAILKAGCGKLDNLAGLQVRAGAEIVWKVWQTNQTEWMPDYQPDAGREQWIQNDGFSAALGIPLSLKGLVVFVVTLFYEQPGFSISEEEIELLSLFGQIASINLQHKDRTAGYQSEIDDWKHKLDDLAARHQNEIEDWQRQLETRSAAHQVEINDWKQKLADRSTAHQSEAEDWKRKLDTVQYRARLEHIVAVIAAHMISVDPEKVDEVITRSLQTIAKFAGIDRGYLVLFPKDNYQELDQPTWYSSNPSTDHPDEFSGDEFQWGLGRLNQLETIHIPRVADLNLDKDEPAAYLQAKGIKSFTAIPLVSNRAVTGYLGFEALRLEMEWSQDVLALMKVFADMLVNLLERKWARQSVARGPGKNRRSHQPAGTAQPGRKPDDRNGRPSAGLPDRR